MTLAELKAEAGRRDLLLIDHGLDTYNVIDGYTSERYLEAVTLADVERYLVPTTDVAATEPDALDARGRADAIRSCLGDMAAYVERMTALVTEAWKSGDWAELGYDDWRSYVEGEFATSALKLGRVLRHSIVNELTAVGMSSRAIAPVVGVDQKTVVNDRKSEVDQAEEFSSDVPPAPDDKPLEGKVHKPRRPVRLGTIVSALERFRPEDLSADERTALATALRDLIRELEK